MKISVVIAAKNEENTLPDCMQSVDFVDDVIVIVDSKTSDQTAELAELAGARVFRKEFRGFATQKNFGIDQAKNDWILILDADERVTPKLAKLISELNPTKETAGYSINFRNYLGNKWLRHGGLYPDPHIRLFDKSRARYGKREVHETLEFTSGNVKSLNGDIIHLTYRNTRDYLRKVRRYSAKEAQENIRLKQAVDPKPLLAAIKELIKRYVKLLGVLDGWAGLVSASLLAYYRYRALKLTRDA